MAKIADLLAAGRTVSFELPPPKTPQALVTFDETMEDLAQLHPSFISVTYGASGSGSGCGWRGPWWPTPRC